MTEQVTLKGDNNDDDHQVAVSTLLEMGWKGSDGFSIPIAEERKGFMDNPTTYGEVTNHGSRNLFRHLKLSDLHAEEKSVFLDVGSGVGKLLVQAYMDLPGVSQFIGIELSHSRHVCAISAWNSVKDEALRIRNSHGGPDSATLTLLHGDFFGMHIGHVTNMYVSSMCFSDRMMRRLGEKLIKEGLSLQQIASIRKFPDRMEDRLGIPKCFHVEMSWSRPHRVEVFFYSPRQ